MEFFIKKIFQKIKLKEISWENLCKYSIKKKITYDFTKIAIDKLLENKLIIRTNIGFKKMP